MIYELRNPLNGIFEYVDTEEEANLRLEKYKAEYLLLENNKSPISKVTTDGNNSTWQSALDTDLEDGDYRMFIHPTAEYQSFTSLSAAKSARQAIINLFEARIIDNTWAIVDKIPEQPRTGYILKQPTATIESF